MFKHLQKSQENKNNVKLSNNKIKFIMQTKWIYQIKAIK